MPRICVQNLEFVASSVQIYKFWCVWIHTFKSYRGSKF